VFQSVCPQAIPMDSPDSHPMVEPLSDRERDILLLIAEGLSNREIAGAVGAQESSDPPEKLIASLICKRSISRPPTRCEHRPGFPYARRNHPLENQLHR
jgi:hypothetical protein